MNTKILQYVTEMITLKINKILETPAKILGDWDS